jgi:hypothetical protein
MKRILEIPADRRAQDLLAPALAAAFLGMAPKTLANHRVKGTGPPYIALSPRALRYRVDDLVEWYNSRYVRKSGDVQEMARRTHR